MTNPQETTMHYEVPKAKLADVIRAAYDLSSPQGMGYLHFKEGCLDQASVDAMLEQPLSADDDKPYLKQVYMDYVRGRAVKLCIHYGGNDTWYIEGPRWYDHTESALLRLAEMCGLKEKESA